MSRPCTYTPEMAAGFSPGRVDVLVYVSSELMVQPEGPATRFAASFHMGR